MVQTRKKIGFPTALMITLVVLFGSETLRSASSQNLGEQVTEPLGVERNYGLSDGFRSVKWGAGLGDAKKIYPDLLFVEQIPRTEPKYFYYRKKNENKKFSGLDWDSIRYVFVNNLYA